MAQGELGHRVDIGFLYGRAPAPGAVRPCSAQPDQVGTQAIDPGGITALGDPGQGLIVQGNQGKGVARFLATLTQLRLGGRPLRAKGLRVAVERQAATDDLLACVRFW